MRASLVFKKILYYQITFTMPETILDPHVEDLARLLKSMSHPIRLKILCLLQDREMTVGEIREEIETSGANITQHLNILRYQGIIEFRRDANFIHNRISDKRIITLMRAMEQIFCARDKEQADH